MEFGVVCVCGAEVHKRRVSQMEADAMQETGKDRGPRLRLTFLFVPQVNSSRPL